MNLTWFNITLTVKVLRWKRYLQDKDFHLCHIARKEIHQGVPDALSRLCENHMPPKQGQETRKEKTANLSALQLKQHLTNEVYDKIASVHNSSVGHRGQAKCRLKLDDPSVTDRMISTFIASYHPFELIKLDHITGKVGDTCYVEIDTSDDNGAYFCLLYHATVFWSNGAYFCLLPTVQQFFGPGAP